MSKAHLGWFKVEEQAIRILYERFDDPPTYRKAVAVYITLSRIANLEGKDVFSRRLRSIALDCGYSYSETAAGLRLVESAGLCEIEEQKRTGTKENLPSVYRLNRGLDGFQVTYRENRGSLPDSGNFQESPRVSKNFPQEPSQEPTQDTPQPPKGGVALAIGKLRHEYCTECNKLRDFADSIISICTHYLENFSLITSEDLLMYLAICGNDRMAETGFFYELLKLHGHDSEFAAEAWSHLYCMASNAYVEGEITESMCREFPYEIKEFMINHLNGEIRDHKRLVKAQEAALKRIGLGK